jgi:hypothetical protein
VDGPIDGLGLAEGHQADLEAIRAAVGPEQHGQVVIGPPALAPVLDLEVVAPVADQFDEGGAGCQPAGQGVGAPSARPTAGWTDRDVWRRVAGGNVTTRHGRRAVWISLFPLPAAGHTGVSGPPLAGTPASARTPGSLAVARGCVRRRTRSFRGTG